MSYELKPCPFCGRDDARMEQLDGGFCVWCGNCGAETQALHREQDAAFMWNRRQDARTEREALLDLADEVEGYANSYAAQCPGNMKTWVTSATLGSIARKIRKALGVVHLGER